MNVIDYVILAVVGVSVLFGLYRGFLATLLSMGGCLFSFLLSFKLYPVIADYIRGNEGLVKMLMQYTDADKLVGDLSLSLQKVTDLTANSLSTLLSKVKLPSVLTNILRVNIEKRVYAPSGLTTVSDYVSQTVLSTAINVISFILCFLLITLALALLGGLLRAVFKLPVLKQMDTLAGGLFGLLRGALFCYVLFALLPLVQTVVPMDKLNELIAASTLAPVFNSGNLILSVMNGGL